MYFLFAFAFLRGIMGVGKGGRGAEAPWVLKFDIFL